tara:strand:+ start:5393 stop:5989 length:597 start_codon:yes stop_codon:yes gene_type:complete
MTPFDTYKQYLAFKNHFTREKYDYHKYGGRSKAKVESFYKRKDRYFFEKTSRKYKDSEICNFFLANFVATDNPERVWIGNIIRSGETVYKDWIRRSESLFYDFKSQTNKLLDTYELEDLFDTSKGHPPILKEHLANRFSVENMCIYQKLFSYCDDFDKKLDDPVWKAVGMKVRKYLPFMKIDRKKYKDFILSTLTEER